MKYKNEMQVKKALGITDWRHLTKNSIVQFARMMPDMDKETMMKIIDQFPEFREFASTVLDYYQTSLSEIKESNSQNMERLHESINETRKIIANEINKDITFEEKKYYINILMELQDREFKKDTENKHFLADLANKYFGAGVLVLTAALVYLGGRAISTEEEDEDEN